jgi:hypothetical protein
MNKFYMWWISVLLISTGVFWAYHMGFVQTIIATDITYLTSFIAAIFVGANMSLGYYTYRVSDESYSQDKLSNFLDMNWFLSEILMALGMLGTVIGLIHMLSQGNSGADAAQMQSMLGNMWQSMGLALYTNAVGLAASIALKLQVYFLSYGETHETY